MREALVSPISGKGSELSLLMRGVLIAGSPDPGTPDHPRGCREHRRSSTTALSWLGSSPRTRGALTWVPDTRAESRIIPTDAGNTRGPLPPRSWTPDHPRGCGEQITFRTVTRPVRGSSPRMRGALLLKQFVILIQRIIPADAGSTEHYLIVCISYRIIPADAGSTLWTSGSCWLIVDHPRGCGEHRLPSFCDMMSSGSSPRMRGAPVPSHGGLPGLRIIPADAGSTWRQRRWPG